MTNTPIPNAQANGDFLSMHQASKMTGYHQDYLGQLARSGRLDAHKVGRNWFTTKYAIDKFLGRLPEQIAAKEQEPVAPVVASTAVSVNVIKKVEPTPEPVMAVAQEIADVVQQEEIIPAALTVSAIQKSTRVGVKVLAISDYAGPNMHEVLSVPEKRKIVFSEIPTMEGKNMFSRWSKIVSSDFVERVGAKFQTASLPEIKSSRRSGIFSSLQSGLGIAALVSLTAVSAVYGTMLLYDNVSENNLQASEDQSLKMVAGESITPEENSEPQNVIKQGTVTAGKDSVRVIDQDATPKSKIAVTFPETYNGIHWIEKKTEGEFTIRLLDPSADNMKFEYLIVNAE